jgi:hypothetical protein
VYCTAPNLDQQANSPAKRFYIILNIFEYGASRRLNAAQLLVKNQVSLDTDHILRYYVCTMQKDILHLCMKQLQFKYVDIKQHICQTQIGRLPKQSHLL